MRFQHWALVMAGLVAVVAVAVSMLFFRPAEREASSLPSSEEVAGPGTPRETREARSPGTVQAPRPGVARTTAPPKQSGDGAKAAQAPVRPGDAASVSIPDGPGGLGSTPGTRPGSAPPPPPDELPGGPRQPSPAKPGILAGAASEDPDSMGPQLEGIRTMVRDFRSIAGENPVGTNAEITKALMGGNSKGAQLVPAEANVVNGEGEMVDSWGTPLFFHQVSAQVMEIRSAGPDMKLWTADDRTTR